jgi:hypothetical protein
MVLRLPIGCASQVVKRIKQDGITANRQLFASET